MPEMPNITHMQILAGLQWIASQVVAFGIIQHAPSQQMLSAVSTVVAVGLAWADAHLRGKRVMAHAVLNAPVPTVASPNAFQVPDVAPPAPTV